MAKAKQVDEEVQEDAVEEAAPEQPSQSNEVATVSNTQIAVSSSALELLEEDDGEGQTFGADDVTIPRLGIIQSLSPQRSKSKPEYIEGAEEGQIFDNITKQLRDGAEGVTVVPVLYRRVLLEWFPRDSGKGLAKNHGLDFSAYDHAGGQNLPEGVAYNPDVHGEPNDKGQRFTADGNLLDPTAEYYLFVIEKNGQAKPFVLSMSGTALRQAKLWNTMIGQAFAVDEKNNIRISSKTGQPIKAPIFYYAYEMKTVPISNKSGEWFRWEITSKQTTFVGDDGVEGKRALSIFDLPGGERLYKEARDFREAVDKEEVKTAAYEANHGDAEETDADPM